jgi:hypothetical protein
MKLTKRKGANPRYAVISPQDKYRMSPRLRHLQMLLGEQFVF